MQRCFRALLTHSATPSLKPLLLIRRTLIIQTHNPIQISKLSGSDSGIIDVKISRAEAKNAISKEMLKGLMDAVDSIHRDSDAKVVLLTSAVPRIFCAGADLKERKQMTSIEVQLFVNSLRSTFSSIEALPIPTIAVIEGAALGGGLEMVLSCDLRVCGENAMFSLPETGLAIIPGKDAINNVFVKFCRAGGTQRLPRVVGKARAKELIYTGRRVDGKEALFMGLVNHCVSAGEAYPKALQIAREINQKGPLAIRMAKEAINRGLEMAMLSAVTVEEECYEKLLDTQDRLEGLAAFAEKRKPEYRGK